MCSFIKGKIVHNTKMNWAFITEWIYVTIISFLRKIDRIDMLKCKKRCMWAFRFEISETNLSYRWVDVWMVCVCARQKSPFSKHIVLWLRIYRWIPSKTRFSGYLTSFFFINDIICVGKHSCEQMVGTKLSNFVNSSYTEKL